MDPGVVLLIMWFTDHFQTLTYRPLNSHWSIDLTKMTNRPENCSFSFFYSTDLTSLVNQDWASISDLQQPRYPSSSSSSSSSSIASPINRPTWSRVSEGIWRRTSSLLRSVGRVAAQAVSAEIGETAGEELGGRLGSAVGGGLAGPAGAAVVADAPAARAAAAAAAAAAVATRCHIRMIEQLLRLVTC